MSKWDEEKGAAFLRGMEATTGYGGERNGFAKLTEDQVRQIRARIAGGESQASIARDLGIAQQTVSAIHRRETWRGTE